MTAISLHPRATGRLGVARAMLNHASERRRVGGLRGIGVGGRRIVMKSVEGFEG